MVSRNFEESDLRIRVLNMPAQLRDKYEMGERVALLKLYPTKIAEHQAELADLNAKIGENERNIQTKTKMVSDCLESLAALTAQHEGLTAEVIECNRRLAQLKG